MTSKLKPCPICGNEADCDTEPHPNMSIVSIWCKHCTLGIDHSGTGAEADLIKIWNTRPREDALKEALKELIEHSAPLTINHPSEWRGENKYDIAVEKCYAIIKDECNE